MLRYLVRRFIPLSLRRRVRQWRREIGDFLRVSGTLASRRWNNPSGNPAVPYLTVKQPIRPSASYREKLRNLSRAAALMRHATVYPGQVFSFWRWIGNPSQANGFFMSRTLMGEELVQSEGGGLCQMSGMLYEAALRLGFSVLERYNHSVDIYQEEERFTTLGLDAAVVFGFKDLRFRNDSAVPVVLEFEISERSIALLVFGEAGLEPPPLHQVACERLTNTVCAGTRKARVLMTDTRTGTVRSVTSTYKVLDKNE